MMKREHITYVCINKTKRRKQQQQQQQQQTMEGPPHLGRSRPLLPGAVKAFRQIVSVQKPFFGDDYYSRLNPSSGHFM